MTTIVEKSEEFAAGLRKSGMVAQGYKRGPVNNSTMSVSIGAIRSPGGPKQGIYTWAGLADIDITGTHKRFRQAVVAVDEPARTITQTYMVSAPEGDKKAIINRAKVHFPVFIPGNPVFKLISSSKNTRSSADPWGINVDHDVEASMTTRATSLTLLMGMDETSHFISALPERVRSVSDAHELLRPDSVPRNAIRQGEWFFIPATDEEIALVTANISAKTAVHRSLERSSSHQGFVVRIPNVGNFTIGTVRDSRKNRHAELKLNTWHKIVRNTEVVLPAMQRTRYWD